MNDDLIRRGNVKTCICTKGEEMSDLISREAAINAICEHGTELERMGITVLAVSNHKQVTVDLLESLPSAQLELIRCKDCRKNPKIAWFECPMAGKSMVFDDGFCHMGERIKEDE